MAFTLSGSTITQSGTDTSYAGLSGIAGVTVITAGAAGSGGYIYSMPGLVLLVTGTLTIADPSKETIIAARLSIAATGNFTSGTFAADGETPKTSGTHFTVLTGADFNDTYGSNCYEVNTGGRSTLIGGNYKVPRNIWYSNGAIIREYGVDVIALSDKPPGSDASNSIRVRATTTDVVKRNCRHYDVGYDLFRMPTEFSVKAFGSVYVAQYVGSAAGGADAKYTASALSNVDGSNDFDNWGGGYVELYNCAKGANLNVNSSASRANHCVPLYQDVNFTVTDLAGIAQQNVRLRCIDAPVSNSPTSTITTAGGLKTWDFRNAQTYTATTDAAGKATLTPVLKVWHGVSNLQNLRFPASTATIRLVGYAVRQQDVAVVLGSDTAIAKGVALVPATGLTLTEAQAAALTGIAFVANGTTGGTATVTVSRTTSEIWQAWRNWKGQLANADSADSWEYASSGLLNTGAWSVVVNDSAITGNITTTGTVTLQNGATVSGVILDANNAGSISVTGVGVSDTAEMRRASDNSLIASRTGPGAFSVSPTNVGVSVYFVRLVGSNIVMSTITTPVTLTAGVNPDVPLFAGAEVQVAQAARIDLLPTLTDIEASSVLARKPDLQIINTGVKKASLSIPHTGNLP